jgi:hypothetical protein
VQRRQAVVARKTAAIRDASLRVQISAAVVLQQAWRRYSHRKTFAFYRDLIAFKEQCDPKQVLKHINPVEANLVDAAAGANLCAQQLSHLPILQQSCTF